MLAAHTSSLSVVYTICTVQIFALKSKEVCRIVKPTKLTKYEVTLIQLNLDRPSPINDFVINYLLPCAYCHIGIYKVPFKHNRAEV